MRFTSDYSQDFNNEKGRIFTLFTNPNKYLHFNIADKTNNNYYVNTDVALSLNTWYFFAASVSYLTGFNILICYLKYH